MGMTFGQSLIAVVVGLSFCVFATWAATTAALFKPMKRIGKLSPETHWTEKARYAYGLRKLLRHALLWMPLYMTLMMTFYTDVASITGWPRMVLTWPLPWIASATGVWLTYTQVENKLLRLEVPLKRWFHGSLFFVLFAYGHVTVGVLLGSALPARLDVLILVLSVFALALLGVGAKHFWRLAVARGLLQAEPALEGTAMKPDAEARMPFYRIYHPKSLYVAIQDRALLLTTHAADVLDAQQRSVFHNIWSTAFEWQGREFKFGRLLMATATAATAWFGAMILANRSVGEWLLFIAAAMFGLQLLHKREAEKMDVPLKRAISLQKNRQAFALGLLQMCEDNLEPVVPMEKDNELAFANVYKRITDAGLNPDFSRPAPPVVYPRLVWIAWGTLVIIAGIAPIMLSFR